MGRETTAEARGRAALALGTWVLACGGGAAAVLVWAAPWAVAVARHPAAAGPGDLLAVLAAAALAAVLLVWLAGALVCALEAALHRARPTALPPGVVGGAHRLVPAVVRRLAATALGASLLTGALAPGATAAGATAGTAGRADAAAAFAVPAWPAEGESWEPPAPDPGPGVVVRPGDSLWRIAERHLPAGAPPRAVVAAWPQWWSANRAVVGDDPDLLVPGQVLHAPPVHP